MVERMELDVVIKDSGPGRILRHLRSEMSSLNKAAADVGRGAGGAANSLRQLDRVARAGGMRVLAKDVHYSKQQLDALGKAAQAANGRLVGAERAFGLNAAGVDAFTRASTRAVAALGFISPTAATAAAQLQGLGKFSAHATLALAGLSVVAIAAGAALVGSVKAAINFESSFTGIRKTLDLTEPEFKKLERANRDLALSLPISVNEINRIGETAGALGISGVANILAFERAVAQVAISTNVTADEAAMAFGQIANILKMPIADVDRLAATLVDLGNKGASTESQILSMAIRIAGGAKLLRLTAADVLGIASSFASVGVEAEAGGTAIQRVMIGMVEAVAQGGDALKVFAAVTQTSTDEFTRLVKEAPLDAFVLFVEGLRTAGDDAIRALDAMGMADARLIRAFLSTANAEELLRFQTELAKVAWEKNAAAAEETAKKTQSAAAQLQLAKNRFTDLGITVGQFFLPALITTAKGLGLVALMLRSVADAGPAASASLLLVAGSITTLLVVIGAISGPLGWAALLLGMTAVISGASIFASQWRDVIGQLPDPVYEAVRQVARLLDFLGGQLASFINKARQTARLFHIPGVIEGDVEFGSMLDELDRIRNEEKGIAALQKAAGYRAPGATLPGMLGAGIPGLDDLLDSLDKADKKVRAIADALSDGIITLAEAMEFGLSQIQVVTLELGHEAEEFANRVFRAEIELAKAAIRAGDSTHNLAIALVELQEEEVKASARTLEIRREMVKIFIVMASSAEIAARATALNAEANLAFAQQGVKTRIEFKALSQLLGQQGLTRHAATFRAALVSLGQELRRAGESGVAALHRLAGAILDFAQTQLSALLGGPTRETLMTETRLAELRRQRLLLLQGGQTEEELAPLLGPLDQEIEAIERLLAIRQQEIEIMRLRGQLADAGVLTDREMLRQATLLIGLIASQSEIVRDLNTQLAWEQLAIIGARDSLNLFADALVRARDVVSSISEIG